MATILDRYQQRMAQLRDAAAAGVGQAWDDLGSYDESDVDRFLSRATPVVAASQAHAVALTDAYFAAETGRSPLGLPLDSLTGAGARNGTPPADVYRRPFVQVWAALAKGTLWADAVSAGGARVASAASTDVQLSMRAASREIGLRDGRITGFRRVLSGKSCALCASASTRTYSRGDLLPIHGNCDCTVAPIIGRRDPGARSPQPVQQDGPAPAVHEHGELGPVLTDADHEFTSL